MNPYSTGAEKSPYDLRTFAYTPEPSRMTGGIKYSPKDIEHQHKVGICTAISLTENARKAMGVKFSADFQYLMQKSVYDKNWREGSSISSALKVAKNVGLIPDELFIQKTGIIEKDRFLPYDQYIEKLKAIPQKKIDYLKSIAQTIKIRAFASVPVTRDFIADAISESESGLLVRFDVGEEWWTKPIEPLRPPKKIISGHAIIESNYDGDSFWVANTWGKDWADKGTARHLFSQYKPTEAWIVYYNDIPDNVVKKLNGRTTIWGGVVDLLQKFLSTLK